MTKITLNWKHKILKTTKLIPQQMIISVFDRVENITEK